MKVAQLPLNAFYRLCARKCDGRLHFVFPLIVFLENFLRGRLSDVDKKFFLTNRLPG